MAQRFSSSLDIAKRTMIHLGALIPSALTDDSKNVQHFLVLYDKARRAELRRAVWTFAVRRMALRKDSVTMAFFQPPVYSAVVTYNRGAVVQDSESTWWISLENSNLANTPGDGLWWMTYYGPQTIDTWDTAVLYFPGEIVNRASASYTAIGYNTAAQPPNATYWGAWSAQASGKTIPRFDMTPYNTALSTDTRNVFYLPYNFMRMAPQDPKQANIARLAVSAEMRYRDWEVENGRLLTADAEPLPLRFVADTTDVSKMDPLFCEALAARVAMEACEAITQAKDIGGSLAQVYTSFIREAHEQNAIEFASTENKENPEAEKPEPPQGRSR